MIALTNYVTKGTLVYNYTKLLSSINIINPKYAYYAKLLLLFNANELILRKFKK